MHHFVTEMYTRMHISVRKRDIVHCGMYIQSIVGFVQ